MNGVYVKAESYDPGHSGSNNCSVKMKYMFGCRAWLPACLLTTNTGSLCWSLYSAGASAGSMSDNEQGSVHSSST